ncbi:uncharacterized protein LOC131237962 isoform X2 [Magnolia sinica]|uniref:uncharacterized protein LOC131237962 isoform X2 n=1 Tax=Magnolia sinica TaxID=86752 RepID=UPI0026580315|nr:uncharacterized protein LOC131237962 isoform X2 [Magnolia sinica]
MEASVRLFNTTHHLNHHLSLSVKTRLQHHHSLRLSSNAIPRNPFCALHIAFPLPAHRDGRSIRTLPSASLSASHPSNALTFLLSLSLSRIFPPPSYVDRLDSSVADTKQQFFARNRSTEGGNVGFCGEKGQDLTVVMLGWLGAEQRHLRRYGDFYSSRGIRAVPFVVPMRDLLGFDLGRKVEGRIAALAEDLIEWLSEREKDEREPALLFHTFSNTGWLVYGAILDKFQQRGDFAKKIKGCIIDSGPEPELNPQVWAAGFSAALLKQRCSSAYSSAEVTEGSPLDGNLGYYRPSSPNPEFVGRLKKIISILSSDQPPCPQLYLYSTADKVIPARSVESFIREQKKSGRKRSFTSFWRIASPRWARRKPTIGSKASLFRLQGPLTMLSALLHCSGQPHRTKALENIPFFKMYSGEVIFGPCSIISFDFFLTNYKNSHSL